jgi:DMSO/TMAO reductase YedYZ molybdopterin-dependent catalytic subunit
MSLVAAMEDEIIKSPDTQRPDRVPPGQHLVEGLPVLHFSRVPRIDIAKWRFTISGLVESPGTLTYEEFTALPRSRVFCDIHCVTTWSSLGHTWEGVLAKDLPRAVKVLAEARFVTVHCLDGYTTNLPLDEFCDGDVIFATHLNGKPIPPDHGWPVRLVVPKLYFWKSAKWASGVEFMAEDKPGFWETRGYHNHGDPWTEERFG